MIEASKDISLNEMVLRPEEDDPSLSAAAPRRLAAQARLTFKKAAYALVSAGGASVRS